MKKTDWYFLFVFLYLLIFTASVSAQEKFDIVSFTIAKDWEKTTLSNSLSMLKTDETGGNGMISIFKPVPLKEAVSKINFPIFWNDVVRTVVNAADPQMQPTIDYDGWKADCGIAQYTSENKPLNFGKGMALLCSFSGNDSVVNVLAVSNTKPLNEEVFNFIDSIKLPPISLNDLTAPAGNISGSWERSSSVRPNYIDPVKWGKSGQTKSTYQFISAEDSANSSNEYRDPANISGEYRYYEESAGDSGSQIILVEEWGTYKLDGSEITLTPQTSFILRHAKKGKYEPGKLLKKENRALETVKYRYETFYRQASKRFYLFLEADAQTKRDGAFSEDKTYRNGWLFENIYAEDDDENASPPPLVKKKVN